LASQLVVEVGDFVVDCYDGEWTEATGFCRLCSTNCENCNDLPVIPTGYTAGTCSDSNDYASYATGQSCSLACDTTAGYSKSSTGTLQIICNNGMYSSPTGTCTKADGSGGKGSGASGSKSSTVGIAVGVCLGVAAAAALIGFFIYKRNAGKGERNDEMRPLPS